MLDLRRLLTAAPRLRLCCASVITRSLFLLTSVFELIFDTIVFFIIPCTTIYDFNLDHFVSPVQIIFVSKS